MFRARPQARLAQQQPLGSRAGLPAWRARFFLRSCGKTGHQRGSKGDSPAGAGVGTERNALLGHLGLSQCWWWVTGMGAQGAMECLAMGTLKAQPEIQAQMAKVSQLSVPVTAGQEQPEGDGTAGTRRREEAKPWLR